MSNSSIAQFTPKSHVPMTDLPYRVAHLWAEGNYWTAHGWGMKSEAMVFTAADRQRFSLPAHGCWEVVEREAPKNSRQVIAGMIAQALFAQWLKEEERPPCRLQDGARSETERFIRAGELIVQMTLNPDLERTAIFAAVYADHRDLFDRTDTLQAVYFTQKRSEIRAYQHTLMHTSNPEDDRRLDDRLAILEAKGLVGEEVTR